MRLKPFVRVCALCGKKENKQNLKMFKKVGNQIVFNDNSFGGKSIYLCSDCTKKIDNPKFLNKAFRMNVSSENSEKLLKQLKEN